MRRIVFIAWCAGLVGPAVAGAGGTGGTTAATDDAAVARALRAAHYKDVKVLARGPVVVATAADRGGSLRVIALATGAKGKPLDLGDAVGTVRAASIGTFLKSKDLVEITYLGSTSAVLTGTAGAGTSEIATNNFLVRTGKRGLELACAFPGAGSSGQGDETTTTTTTVTSISETPLVFEVASHTVRRGGMKGGLGPEDHVVRYTIVAGGPCDEVDVTPADQLPY